MLGPFVQQSNDRRLPADYDGPVLLWDIDKTYLDTNFSTKRGLLTIPFELAIDKRNVPGSVALLRALRRGPGKQAALTPLYFVSGSPPQLRRVVEKKMVLDGVQFDGITFKDQWGLVRAGRVRDVKRQIGYKLLALLGYRRSVPAGARWLMFGDDVEQDAEAFLLFGEVLARLRGRALAARLEAHEVHPDDVARILELSDTLETGSDPVERIFIHLSARSDPARFTEPRLVASRSYVQTALVLAMEARVAEDTIPAVAKALRRHRVPEQVLAEHLLDAERRLHVPRRLTNLARG